VTWDAEGEIRDGWQAYDREACYVNQINRWESGETKAGME